MTEQSRHLCFGQHLGVVCGRDVQTDKHVSTTNGHHTCRAVPASRTPCEWRVGYLVVLAKYESGLAAATHAACENTKNLAEQGLVASAIAHAQGE